MIKEWLNYISVGKGVNNTYDNIESKLFTVLIVTISHIIMIICSIILIPACYLARVLSDSRM